MPFDPDQYLVKKVAPKAGGFDPDSYLNKKSAVTPDAIAVTEETKPTDFAPKEEIGKAESAFRGGIGGITFGFGDELGGHLEALGSKIGVRGLGSPNLKDVRLESDQEDAQSYDEIYQAMRDRRRALDKAAEEQNPISFTAGNIAGGIATVPVGGAVLKGATSIPQIAPAATAAKQFFDTGSNLQKAVKLGIAEGGAYGAGSSEGDSINEVAFDTLKGAGVGGLSAGVFNKGSEVVGKGAKFVGEKIAELKPTQKAVEIISNLAFDLPPQYTDALIKNSKLKDVRTYDDLEDALVKTTNTLKSDLMAEGKKAWALLDDKPVIMSDELADTVYKNIDSMKILGSDLANDKAAVAKAESVLNTLGAGKQLSEKDIKTLVQKLDREIDWGNMERQTSNDLLKNIRREFDAMIKGNQAYQDQMQNVSKLRNGLQIMEEKFGFKPKGNSYETTDMTLGKMRNMFDAQGNIKKPETVAGLTEIDPALVDEIKMRSILDRTEGGVTQGSRNVLTGTAIGTAGGIPGMMVGAAAGYVKDKYGRKIGKEFIDKNRDTILNRDQFFQKMGQKLGKVGESVSKPSAEVTSGITAAMVPQFIADELSKDMSKLDETEKRTVTKIYLLKQKNPGMSEAQIKELMKKSIPGYQQKSAADDFLKD